MKLYGCFVILLVCSIQTKLVHCAKILGFFVTLSPSHFIVQEPVMRELAKRGHQVTIITTVKQSGEPLTNYRYIEILDFNELPEFKVFQNSAMSGSINSRSFSLAYKIMDSFSRLSLEVMNHEKFRAIKNESFDLLVLGWFMNDYVLGLSGHFKCPSVVISPNANFYTMRKLSGNPSSVSTIPFIFVNYETPMTFFERLKNAGIYLMEFAMLEGLNQIFVKPLYLEAFPPDQFPSYDEVLKNVSLILVTQHFSGRTPEPLLPGVIEVGGMHVKKEPSPLPQVIILLNTRHAESISS